MISFVARSWRNHSNALPIPFCQNFYTNNNKTSNQTSNQAYYPTKQISKPSYNFIDLITQYNINNNALAKNTNSCKHMQYYKMAAAPATMQQQTNSKITKTSNTQFEDIVVPCTFGEWIILRLMQSEHQPMFLTQQQVEQIIALKENTNLDEQSLQKFYNILISQPQPLPVLKPVQCLKQAIYNAYNDNCGNATQKCKFSLYKKGIARIEPLNSENQPAANNYYKQFNSMQGAGDTNTDKILWRGKNGFIKLEPYQSNKLPEQCDNLPNLYDVSVLDTQHIKNIKEMYELYEQGLKKMKANSEKNLNKLPKWALTKYGYEGMEGIIFDPTSNRYMFRNQFRRNQRRGRFRHKNRFQLKYNFQKKFGNNTRRLSEITGTNLKSSKDTKGQSKSDDEANNSKNKAKNSDTTIDLNASRKGQRIKFSNDSKNRDLKRSNRDELELNAEGENNEPEDEYTLTHKGSTKNIDDVGAISKMMKMKARHAKYAALQPALLAKLYRNAMANKDSVNPEELEALKIYVEQIMPINSEMNVSTQPKWEPHRQYSPKRRSSVYTHALNNDDDDEEAPGSKPKSKKVIKKPKVKANVLTTRKRSSSYKLLF